MPAAPALYFATPPSQRNPVLLAISLLFYAFDAGWMTSPLIVSIILNHVAAKAVAKAAGWTRPAVFASAVAVNLALLFYNEYMHFA